MGAGMVLLLADRGGAFLMRPLAAAASAGVSGSTAGYTALIDAPMIVKAVVVSIACTFGLLSTLSRAQAARAGGGALRLMLMNAGAVYTLALSTVFYVGGPLPVAAVLGLGIGLMGTKGLEILEDQVAGHIGRIFGRRFVTRDEMDEVIGIERNRVQGVISEQVVKDKGDD